MDIVYNSETKVFSRDLEPNFIPENGLGYNLMKKMKIFGNAVAQIDALTGKTETFSELLLKCIRTALEMKSRGIKKGEVIGICSYNHMNTVVPFVAAHFLGAIVSATDPTISLIDTTYLIGVTKPKLCFVSSGSEELITSAINESGIDCSVISFGSSSGYESFDNFISEKEGENNFEALIVNNTEPAEILFSSGTSGLPKAVILGNDYMLLQIFNINYYTSEVPKSLIIYSSPYWLSFPMFVGYTLFFGIQRVISPSFNPETHWSIVNKYEVEFIFLAPVHAISSIKYAEHHLVRSVKALLVGGSVISSEYLSQLKVIFKNDIRILYGMTEIGIIVSNFLRDDKWKTKTSQCGMISPGSILKIVNPDTEEVLGFNQVGELRAKPLFTMLGYLNDNSANCYDADGYFKTGDLMRYDEDYCFYYCDRLKEVFKYLSWHIQPTKLERILEKHPDVLLSCVIGIPHSTDDNHIMAFIVLNKNAKSSAEDLQKFVDSQVDDRYKVRGGVVIINEMPLTPSGKIKRKELREMAKNIQKIN